MARFMPKETAFFTMFSQLADSATTAAHLLRDTLRDLQHLDQRTGELKRIEHNADEVTHDILIKLNKTFITPFDREDIHRLASSLDDVIDFIYSAGERTLLYNITVPTRSAEQLAEVIVAQCEQIAAAVRKLERPQEVLQHCVEINRLENEADRLLRAAIAGLFTTEKEPIPLIKLKELYEVLETATDKAEDVANTLESIVLKNS
jgi:predicted phosphate transport protein (TIGR00153 family)